MLNFADANRHWPNALGLPAHLMTNPFPANAGSFSTAAEAAFGPQAKRYALREIARRAGVTAEFFATWRIETSHDATIVHIGSDSGRVISFPAAPQEFWNELTAGKFRIGQPLWPLGRPDQTGAAQVPRPIVPFVPETVTGDEQPLFAIRNSKFAVCNLDLLLSTLLTLSRFEETLSGQRDFYGRFPATEGVAFREGFLGRPIVDEYGLALQQTLEALLPGWKPLPRFLRAMVTHDVDNVGLPFSFRPTVGHVARRWNPSAALRDLAATVSPLDPAYLHAVRRVVTTASRRGLKSSVFWKAGPSGPMDSGYDLRHPKIRRTIEWLADRGVEQGVHPGFETFRHPEKLRAEVNLVREAVGDQVVGGRQHYLRWCPDTWAQWEDCGLAYDSSVGFADHVGFRAGTCHPYRPWSLSEGRELNIIEIPLIAMEVTLTGYMDLGVNKSVQIVKDLVDKCRLMGGVFTFLYHNDSILDLRYDGLYERVLDQITGTEAFDWRSVRTYCLINGKSKTTELETA
jgi:hypothetical protein